MSSHTLVLPDGFVDAKIPLLVVAIIGEVAQGVWPLICAMPPSCLPLLQPTRT